MIKRRVAAALATFALVLGGATAAQAASSEANEPAPESLGQQVSVSQDETTLDPATYEGTLIVATPEGDVYVDVAAGEAALFADRTDGSLESLPEQAQELIASQPQARIDAARADGGCGNWQNAVAGPGVYWESVNGCAVIGYNGYQRTYSWSNQGNMTICVQGRSGSNAWYTLGCAGPGGGHSDVAVPWGNVLNYTKVKGQSVSTVTTAAYVFWD